MYGKNIYLALSVVIICTICCGFQCKKSFACAEILHHFEIKLKAFPDKDSINIGDTIWVEVNESTKFKDIDTGMEVDWSGAANLGSALSFIQISGNNEFSIAPLKMFEFKLIDGTEVKSLDAIRLKEFTFSERNNRYTFKLGIIPKEKGIYSFLLGNASSVYLKNNHCSKSNFKLNFRYTDQHYYFNPSYQGGTLVGGDYYFKVY